MAALPNLITVEQYSEIEDPPQGRYELHAGELVFVTFAKRGHHLLQRRMVELLDLRIGSFGEVAMEVAFRPTAQFELRAADVAATSHARASSIGPNEYLLGAPELVIEIKSPSNRRGRLRELAALCLANAAIEFWVVDMDKKSVTVTRRDGTTTVYGVGQSVPLTAFGSDSLPVDEIFA